MKTTSNYGITAFFSFITILLSSYTMGISEAAAKPTFGIVAVLFTAIFAVAVAKCSKLVLAQQDEAK